MGTSICTLPGYEAFYDEFGILVTTYPPPFMYIQDTQTLRATLNAIDALLRDLSTSPASPTNPSKIYYARADCVACFTPRLFYEAVINTLIGWEPDWEDGCANWSAEGAVGAKWNENMDMFLHGLRAAHQHLSRLKVAGTKQPQKKSEDGKGKGKEIEVGDANFDDVRFIIVVERVERLKESLPEMIVPLTRLAELARIDLSVVFVSQVGWEDVKPPLGASPDPYYIDIQAPSKENIVQGLISNFSSLSTTAAFSSSSTLTPYHPMLEPLYSHFITILCDVCFPFTHDPSELQYIAAARWPGFCRPILDQYQRRNGKSKGNDDGDVEAAMDVDRAEDDSLFGDVDPELPPIPITTDIRMRLTRVFNATLTQAVESLVPRLSNAADWARENDPPPDLLSIPPAQAHLGQPQTIKDPVAEATRSLPRMSKFILLASFLASTNPAKSDIRIFGRGLDEKRKRRRRAAPKTSGKTKSGGPSKVPQRLLGPAGFPLDRMLAILGALLEENDIDSRMSNPQFTIPGEETDMEISRIGVYTSIMELTSMRLLHRASPPDRLDGPPQFKCAVSYDTALLLARELKVALNDLLWDPMATLREGLPHAAKSTGKLLFGFYMGTVHHAHQMEVHSTKVRGVVHSESSYVSYSEASFTDILGGKSIVTGLRLPEMGQMKRSFLSFTDLETVQPVHLTRVGMKRGFLKNVVPKKKKADPPPSEPSALQLFHALGVLADLGNDDNEEAMTEDVAASFLELALDRILEKTPPCLPTEGIAVPNDYDGADMSQFIPSAGSNSNLRIAAIPSAKLRKPGEGQSLWVFYGPTIVKVLTAEGYPRPVPQPRLTEPSFVVKRTPNMGLGLFATRDIEMGELILAERPLLVAPRATYGLQFLLDPKMRAVFPRSVIEAIGLKEWDNLLKVAFDKMDPEDQEAYMQLTNRHKNSKCGPLWGIMQTNSFSTCDELFDGERNEHLNTYCAVVKIGSRINHSCMPNVEWKFSRASFSYQFTASVDIKAGEQIFGSYTALGTSVALRQAALAPYGFVCHCNACEHATPETDALRMEYEEKTKNFLLNLNWKGEDKPEESIIQPVVEFREALLKEGLAFTREYTDTVMMLGKFYEGIGMAEKAKPFLDEYEKHKLVKGDK